MTRRLAVLGALALTLTVATAGCGGLTAPDAQSTPSPPAFAQNDGNVTVDAAADQTITAYTTLDAGANATVRVQSSDSDSPFIKTRQVTAGENGTVRATFNFTRIDPGTQLDVTLRHNDTTRTTASGVVTA